MDIKVLRINVMLLERIIKWFTFSVLIALLPYVWNALSFMTQGRSVTIEMIFSRGELLLLSCGISATALGELIGSGRSLLLIKFIVGSCCVATLMLNSLWFSQVSLFLMQGAIYDKNLVANGSITIFIFSLLAALGARIISEVI